MRTTLTLERDVAEGLRREMRRTGKGLKTVVNDALRIGLHLSGKRARLPRFAVQAHPFGFKPGVDLDRLNQLVDELDVQDRAQSLAR